MLPCSSGLLVYFALGYDVLKNKLTKRGTETQNVDIVDQLGGTLFFKT
jgi:hypothetical protein